MWVGVLLPISKHRETSLKWGKAEPSTSLVVFRNQRNNT